MVTQLRWIALHTRLTLVLGTESDALLDEVEVLAQRLDGYTLIACLHSSVNACVIFPMVSPDCIRHHASLFT
jgi:hypothetical protein